MALFDTHVLLVKHPVQSCSSPEMQAHVRQQRYQTTRKDRRRKGFVPRRRLLSQSCVGGLGGRQGHGAPGEFFFLSPLFLLSCAGFFMFEFTDVTAAAAGCQVLYLTANLDTIFDS